ncbi:hypothetical protein J4437_08000 [Candidatus Woesearchaeota archaeon]|nr:hypothetical protein [Candidatus Woesearchaeota archaeon]
MIELKRIGVLSLAKIQAVLMFIFGLIMAVLGLIAIKLIPAELMTAGVNTSIQPLSLLTVPIFYGIIGFITGAIGALLYNLAARWMGGINLDLKK